MPPKVQSLDEILAELETAYAPVRGIYEQQKAAIPQKFENRRLGLEGARVKGFDRIAGQAGRAGMSWGGITEAEQADYLADKFLPGMQQTYYDQDQEQLGIAKSLAQLELERRSGAMNKREGQEKSFMGYQEAERDRAFRAQQAALDRQATAANNARKEQTIPKLVKNKQGGWDVGGDMDLAGYARATGADLITLMSQGDKQDRQAAKWYLEKLRKYGPGENNVNADRFFQELQRDRPTAFYRGG